MKKTIITALVVLLVMLAFATCDSFITEPGSENSGTTYTADGRELVTVTIKTGGTAGRALSKDIAIAEANWYEVVFKDGTNASGPWGLPLKVSIAKATYGEDDAIMLIGKQRSVSGLDNYTLLATGYIAIDVNLKVDPPEITFTVDALEADLTTTGNAFEITNDGYTFGVFNGKTKDGSYYLNKSDCFLVPFLPSIKTVDAKLTIGGFENTGNKISLKNTPNDSSHVSFNLTKTTDTSISPITLNALPTPNVSISKSDNCVFTFSFNTQGEAYYVITFAIPVYGFGKTNALSWDIRGGPTDKIYPDLIIDGKTFNGQGVALEVASDPSGIKEESLIHGELTP